jgi:hypothetical protein
MKDVIIESIPSDVTSIIQAQAHVAFSKSNRAAGVDVEDFVSIGYEVYWKALRSWDSNKNTKFNTFLTLCLQRQFYKVNSKTMRKKRGGAGNKAEDKRFGREWRWTKNGTETTPELVKIHSLSISADDDRTSDLDFIQIEAPENTAPEYELLVRQVAKLMSPADARVYKQMVDPDQKLLEIAAKAVLGHATRKCTISDDMLAKYLNLNKVELKAARERIKKIVAQQLGYQQAI